MEIIVFFFLKNILLFVEKLLQSSNLLQSSLVLFSAMFCILSTEMHKNCISLKVLSSAKALTTFSHETVEEQTFIYLFSTTVLENVYNEIDDFAVMDPSITYAKVMETSLVGTHANLDTGESRNLPRRDDYRKEQLLTSQVNCGEYVHIKEEGVPKDVYSQVVPKALRQNQKTEEKTTRNEDKKHVNDKTDGEVKTTIRKPQRSTLKKSDVQYKSMECILVDTASNVSHEYANTLPRSIKRKVRIMK